MPTAEPHGMTCMEVWGGNEPAQSGVSLAGLDAWVYCRPYQDAAGGGDVYYVSSCATGRIARLLVADVSGHGSHVTEAAAGLRLLMRRFVNHLSQSKFVQAMNGQFGTLAQSGGFATAAVATFFAPTKYLLCSNAGHPSPLIYRAKEQRWDSIQNQLQPVRKSRFLFWKVSTPPAQDPAVDELPSDMPLGVLDEMHYTEQGVELRVDDLVLFFTDSLVEAHDAAGTLLGPQGLLDLVRRLTNVPPAGLIDEILKQLSSLSPENLQEDDVTVLLIRPNGLPFALPWPQRLAAPFRVLGRIIASIPRGGRDAPWPDFKLSNLGGALFSPLNRLWK